MSTLRLVIAGLLGLLWCAPAGAQDLPDRAQKRAEALAAWRSVAADVAAFTRDEHNGRAGLGRYYLQLWTGDLARYAIAESLPEIALPLTALYAREFESLAVHADAVFYFDPRSNGARESRHPLSKPAPMWVDAAGVEPVLSSAQFVWLLVAVSGDLLRHGEQDFAARALPVAASHLVRWILSEDGIFQVRGWGCDAGLFNHRAFLDHKMRRGFTSGGKPSYCNAVTDIDTWIIAAAAELLRVQQTAAPLTQLDAATAQALRQYVREATALLQARVSPLAGDEHALVLDAGANDEHPDHLFAAYTGQAFPRKADAGPSGAGWDVSHGARQATVLLSLYESRAATGLAWPDAQTLAGFGRAFTEHVFEGDLRRPRLRNFLDGHNGWYRVDLAKGRGYPPSTMSFALLSGPWGLYGPFDPKIADILAATRRLLNSRDPDDIAFRLKTFEEPPENGGTGAEVRSSLEGSAWTLPFLSTIPVRP